ncbi:MAG: substrate-binding domain-containing protein, partial [Anaerolineae bacterium]|nr:substrate-binding domain-containing protein [Anaerolineae bacterium]
PAAAQDGDPLDAVCADYPRVDGSTSTGPLQRVIACAVLDVPCFWTTQGYEPNWSVRAGVPATGADAADAPWGLRTVNLLYHTGTHSAYTNLIYEEADFILVARVPSADELAEAETAGITLDVQPVAWDAFVFIVNVDNPVDSLTLNNLRGIYTGVFTSWEVFGVTEPLPDTQYFDAPDETGFTIHPYTRNLNSGSQELMQRLVLGDLTEITGPDMMQSNMGAPLNVIDLDPRGIGYSVYFYVQFMHRARNVKFLGVDSVPPTFDTIADGSYPLRAEVYAVVRGDAASDSTAVLLRDWLLTPDGQAAVAASGYVPLRE